MDAKLQETELLSLLDMLLNLGPVSKWRLFGLRMEGTSLSNDRIDELISRLEAMALVVVETKEYSENILVPQKKQDEVRELIAKSSEQRGLSTEVLLREIEKDYIGVVKMLTFRRTDIEGRTEVGFSDYSGDPSALALCEKLANMGYLFSVFSSSKKHSYQTFYFRRIPFDAEKALEEFVLGKLNLEGLDLHSDWRVLTVMIYSQSVADVTIDDLRLCLPNFTRDEVSEVVAMLDARGVVSRQNDRVRISGSIKDLVKSYFLLNKYQEFKSSLIQDLRRRVSERLSSLYLLGTVKRLSLLGAVPMSLDPFVTIRRSDVGDVAEEELIDSSKLGILFLTSSDIVIARDALAELEIMFKSAIREETFFTVPSNEQYTAVILWRTVFDKCTEYIKIQDEWIDEKTLAIIESYVPVNVSVALLCSAEGSRDMDVEEMKQRIASLCRTRKVDLRIVGYEATKKAPFHERYIISKDVCFLLSHSIKDVGKSKSATVVLVSRDRKESLVEPSFDYWAYGSKDRLKQKGVIRMSFNEWLETRGEKE